MTEVVGSHQNPDKGELGKRILEDGLPAMFQFAQDEQCWRGTKLKKTPEIERTSLVQPIQFQDYSVTQEPEIDPDHFEELVWNFSTIACVEEGLRDVAKERSQSS